MILVKMMYGLRVLSHTRHRSTEDFFFPGIKYLGNKRGRYLVQYLVLFNTTEYFFSFFLSIFTLKYQYLVVYGSFNYYLCLKYQYSIIKGSLVLENRIFKS